MRITTVRRISQAFFLLLFLWLCVVATFGVRWWQLRGWPINFFVQLDPLAALGTLLTTRTLYAGLWWAGLTLILTILLGRFFCSWVCPFGTIHHAVGYLGRRGRSNAHKIEMNRYRPAQSWKYYVLLFILAAAAAELLAHLTALAHGGRIVPWIVTAGCLLAAALLAARRVMPTLGRAVALLLAVAAAWTALAVFAPLSPWLGGSLQSGLLDPISLLHRSVNLALLPLADRAGHVLSASPRYYTGAGWIAALFLAAVSLNLFIPRFYCRFVCPLGALLGIAGRFAIWRVGKTAPDCSMCLKCELDCEGACQPSGKIRQGECVLCMNCLRTCDDEVIGYRAVPSAAGETPSPDLTRRGFLVSVGSGLLMVPMIRLGNALGANFNPRVIRPPGALAEPDFLGRCVKCGQCMRVCPTNIIQPAGLEAGAEGIWTPVLNFRIGTGGCQTSCVACGNVCPTAAIRPLTLDEKNGRGDFADAGPIRAGLAFVDQGRCLPWSMDRPCVVCQENCPVSPKAIYLREVYSTIRDGAYRVASGDELTLDFGRPLMRPGAFATGDYYCTVSGPSNGHPRRIVENTATGLTIDSNTPWDPPPLMGAVAWIQIRLQRPYVDPERCIGCGICEHECPVAGIKAIRVTAENETRHASRSMLLRPRPPDA
ncbi:MAG: 4Fe-4S binding protein [Kiritimatiellae bacterium]|nr:4Fe-4S binding protein [Kiritimatiellia bacterium]